MTFKRAHQNKAIKKAKESIKSNNTRSMTFYVDKNLHKKMHLLARSQDLTVTEILNTLIRKYCDDAQKKIK